MSLNEIVEPEPKTFIFVDGSYYCFYRYYSLLNWWKNAYPEQPLENPIENSVFVDKFKKTFIENLEQMPKKLNLDKKIKHILIAAKDCKRENIWRNEFFPKYKETRVHDDKFMGGPFFKMVYEDKLFDQAGAKSVLSHSRLEADDCIAITVQQVLEKYPDSMIYIIASDRDYLQLQSSRVKIMNLMYKNITENKSSMGDAEKDLQIKIIMGDVSDNIPSVFPKCGPKPALKCCENKDFFEKKMGGNKAYYDQYHLNEQLISFKKIPKDLAEEFTNTLLI
jgi:5'-3' exonuclease